MVRSQPARESGQAKVPRLFPGPIALCLDHKPIASRDLTQNPNSIGSIFVLKKVVKHWERTVLFRI